MKTISAILIVVAAGACASAQAQQQPAPENRTQPQSTASMKYKAPATDGAPFVSKYATLPTSSEYVIGANDVLAISVWHEPDVTKTVSVRPDGKISLPLLGDVQAAGKTPTELTAEVKTGLEKYINSPEVTVIVQDVKSKKVSVVGEVATPHEIALTGPMTALDAITMAGGLKDFAKKKKIYVLRQMPDGVKLRLAMNYDGALKGKPRSDVTLQPNDVVVVP